MFGVGGCSSQSVCLPSAVQDGQEYTVLALEHKDMEWTVFPCLRSLQPSPHLFLCAPKNTLSTREITREVLPVWKEFLSLNVGPLPLPSCAALSACARSRRCTPPP